MADDGKVVKKGKFVTILQRSNKDIKDDRAFALGEDTQLMFRRTIEDMKFDLKKSNRELANMLDLSPDNAITLMTPSNFDAGKFVAKNIELAVKVYNQEVKVQIAEKQYAELFGEDE